MSKFCPICEGPLTLMIQSSFCPNDCDRKAPELVETEMRLVAQWTPEKGMVYFGHDETIFTPNRALQSLSLDSLNRESLDALHRVVARRYQEHMSTTVEESMSRLAEKWYGEKA